MKIQYVGHSCFLIKNQASAVLAVDPFDPGYGVHPNVSADVTLVSHPHDDHGYTGMISGRTEIITGAGQYNIKGFNINGFLADHGRLEGRWLGMVVCYKIEADGMNLLHLSDIGIMPDDNDIKQFGDVDVLFVPTGGRFTIDSAAAVELVGKINPRVAIPMHYATAGTDRLKFPIEGLDGFVEKMKKVRRIREGDVEIDITSVPDKTEAWVLTPMV